jgi:hypothetical protein
MTLRGLLFGIAAATAAFVMCTPARASSILVNGDFETGTLAGWTVFTTPNGTNGVGLPNVVSFDTTGTGASDAAHFNVGANIFDGTQQGGGLSQTVTVATTGLYTFSANIASQDDANGQINSAAGLFSILIDGASATSINLGPFSSPFQILRGTLSGSIGLSAGSHTFAIEITRPFISFPPATPDQYVDNLTLNAPVAPVVPEPATWLLLGSGLVGMGLAKRRRRF